jgi:hypothetical protein
MVEDAGRGQMRGRRTRMPRVPFALCGVVACVIGVGGCYVVDRVYRSAGPGLDPGGLGLSLALAIGIPAGLVIGGVAWWIALIVRGNRRNTTD